MNDAEEYARLSLAISLGAGLIVAGVGNTIFDPRRWRGQAVVALAGTALASGLSYLLDSPYAAHLAGASVTVLLLMSLGRTRVVRVSFVRLARPFATDRARWATVAVVGCAGVGYEAVRHDCQFEARLDAEMSELSERVGRAEGTPISGLVLLTDRGHAVTAITSMAPRPADELRRVESHLLSDLNSTLQVIRRGGPSDGCNCHGWVFTGGRYGIGGRQVEMILADNGYQLVLTPQPGDVCIYRSSGADREVAHTALVRGILGDGTVLVEGKWGWMGVYLHPVQSSCYGTDFEYYRTARANHLLAISHDPTVSVSGP